MIKTGRRHRIHIPNTVHHVMVRGNNRQGIFYDSECFQKWITILEESVKKFDHQFFCYCCMTNHAHLLIHIQENALADIMQYINYRYARWFNNRYKKVGHLFQDRYRSIEVNDDTYLINLCRYIHLNPISANMVKSIDDYPWSSHQHYATEKTPEWLQITYVLTAIKNKTNQDYVHFMDCMLDRELWNPAMDISSDGNIVFNEEVIRNFALENNKRITPDKKNFPETLIRDIVCKHLHVDYQALESSSRSRQLSHQRIVLAEFWMMYSNLNIIEISKRFHRTHGTVSRQLVLLRAKENNFVSTEALSKIHADINAVL